MPKVPRIAVVGSANIDLITYTDQIPKPGETIFAKDFKMGFGGKGANQAVAARRCGATVSMVARVGDDTFAQSTIDNFTTAGVETEHVLTTQGKPSGVAPIFVDASGQNRILVVKGANEELKPADIDAAEATLAAADFIVLQLEIPLNTVFYTLGKAAQLRVRTILNPGPGAPLPFEEIAQADYVIPNESEAEALTGMEVGSLQEARGCAEFLLSKGLRNVIITLGAQGSLYATAGTIIHVPAFAVDVVDTTGAGDAFIGSLACFLAEGSAIEDAMRRANLYAALSTTLRGTQASFVERERFEAEARRRF